MFVDQPLLILLFPLQKSPTSSHLHHQQRSGRRRAHNNLDKQPVVAVAADEARYNLATRIMSNGVEVIVAGDKTTLPGHPNSHLRILTTTDVFKIPLTLAPSTVKDQMLLLLPQTTYNGNSDTKFPSIKNTQVRNATPLVDSYTFVDCHYFYSSF